VIFFFVTGGFVKVEQEEAVDILELPEPQVFLRRKKSVFL